MSLAGWGLKVWMGSVVFTGVENRGWYRVYRARGPWGWTQIFEHWQELRTGHTVSTRQNEQGRKQGRRTENQDRSGQQCPWPQAREVGSGFSMNLLSWCLELRESMSGREDLVIAWGLIRGRKLASRMCKGRWTADSEPSPCLAWWEDGSGFCGSRRSYFPSSIVLFSYITDRTFQASSFCIDPLGNACRELRQVAGML